MKSERNQNDSPPFTRTNLKPFDSHSNGPFHAGLSVSPDWMSLIMVSCIYGSKEDSAGPLYERTSGGH